MSVKDKYQAGSEVPPTHMRQMSNSELERYVRDRMVEELSAGAVRELWVDQYPGERIVYVRVAEEQIPKALDLAQSIRFTLDHQLPPVRILIET